MASSDDRLLSLRLHAEPATLLAELMRSVGASQVELIELSEDVELVARFQADRPDWLEDRLACWLDLLDPEAAATLRTSRGEGPWMPGWQAIYRGIEVGPFAVLAPWMPPPVGVARVPVIVDPGAGFGSGRHPSTRLCLEALAEVLALGGKGRSVLDVGAGNGILSIAAARLGARVVALEIEPRGRVACVEAARLNGVELRVIDLLLNDLHQDFEIVVANLTNSLVLTLAPELQARLRERGVLILGGLHPQDIPRVEERFRGPLQWRLSACGEWVVACTPFEVPHA